MAAVSVTVQTSGAAARSQRVQIRQQQRDMDRVLILGRARRGFTMVEILTAVAIIAILASMLLLGFKYVGASSKAKKTQVRLETLRNMLHEFEIKGGKMQMIDDLYPPTVVKGWTIGASELLPKGNMSEEVGRRTSDAYAKAALDRTAFVMRLLMSVPESKALLDSMPAEARMTWTLPDGSSQVPILLDAWDNPILYGPRRRSPVPSPPGSTPALSDKPTNKDLLWGFTGMSSPAANYQPADGKGSWVSAGPDEDFSLGDDNLYSDNAK